MQNIKKIEKVLPEDTDLKIKEEWIGIHSINPFVANISSPRSVMLASHLTQVVTIQNGDERIIQTGIEHQLGKNTYSKKLDTDVRIIGVADRYSGIDADSVTATVEIIVIYENLETGQIDYISVPNYFSLHQYFGFEYNWNIEALNTLAPNVIIPKGTILADSPTTRDNGYKFGVNANIALLTIPEVAEDGVVISKTMQEKFKYKVYERRTIEYGIDSFPLNIYGDEENYKAFPEIGEYISDDGVLMVLREYDQELSPALVSKKDTLEFNPMFDKAVYVKGPGGKVIDLKVYKNPRFKRETYKGTNDLVDKYIDGNINFHKKILDIYNRIESDHYRKFRNNNLNISEKLSKLIVNSLAMVNPDNKPIEKTYKNERMDIYRLEFVIEYEVKLERGSKITDLHGRL